MKLILKSTGSYTYEGAVYFRAKEPLDQPTMFRIGERSVKSIERHYNDVETKRLTGRSITEREEKAQSFLRLLLFMGGIIIGLAVGILIFKI